MYFVIALLALTIVTLVYTVVVWIYAAKALSDESQNQRYGPSTRRANWRPTL